MMYKYEFNYGGLDQIHESTAGADASVKVQRHEATR